jgi:serine/threonine protein kinase
MAQPPDPFAPLTPKTLPPGQLPRHLPPTNPFLASLDIDHARFEVRGELGSGAFGVVYEGIDHLTGAPVAIKVQGAHPAKNSVGLFNPSRSWKGALLLLREARILRLVHHSNVMRLVHVCCPGSNPAAKPQTCPRSFSSLALVFERCDTDLAKTLKGARERGLPLKVARHIARELLQGVQALHARGIMHRDLKPENILLKADPFSPGLPTVKIADLGYARTEAEESDAHSCAAEAGEEEEEGEEGGHAAAEPADAEGGLASGGGGAAAMAEVPQKTRHVVTRPFRAPELMLYSDGRYTKAIDIFSVGCIVAELFGAVEQHAKYAAKAAAEKAAAAAAAAAASTEAASGGSAAATPCLALPPLKPAEPFKAAENFTLFYGGRITAQSVKTRKNSKGDQVVVYDSYGQPIYGDDSHPGSHLGKIIEALGRPRDEQLRQDVPGQAPVRAKAVALLDRLCANLSAKQPPAQPLDLAARFPHAGAEAQDLLASMLRIEVGARVSADAALAHDFFREPLFFREITQDNVRQHLVAEMRHWCVMLCATIALLGFAPPPLHFSLTTHSPQPLPSLLHGAQEPHPPPRPPQAVKSNSKW